MRLYFVLKEGVRLFLKLRFLRRKRAGDKEKAIALRETFERLGSIYIKLGQMLALRPDLLSDAYCEELYRLLDRVPPFSIMQVNAVLTAEYNQDPGYVFSEFDELPVASASFAQVHKAKLKSGEVVAVKVQRPNMSEVVAQDVALMRAIARIGDIFFPSSTRLVSIVKEFEDWTKDELDYSQEAAYLKRFTEMSGTMHYKIRTPRVYQTLCTQRVLIMEYIEGKSLAEIITKGTHDSSESLPKEAGKDIVRHLIRHTLEAAHVYGFFHADPHPANIIYRENGELVLIDWGIVGELAKKERILLLRYLRGILRSDVNGSFETLLSLCTVSQSANLQEVKKQYAKIIERLQTTFNADTYLEQQEHSGPMLIECLRLLEANGFAFPVSIIRYGKAFEIVEGLIFALYPTLKAQEMVREFKLITLLNILDTVLSGSLEGPISRLAEKFLDSLEDELVLKG